ncbi:hypothetical protein B0H17DRAFT_1144783 [Mycena rosella]|uniref:Uncharacterized protein n=1 Tax=Mycena rosella TaxID=1033263 RepID=A0AAD7CST9_MYCRO|nr:hypothetical protein B0H17DRAFT_1144783 [Mycena rosella]
MSAPNLDTSRAFQITRISDSVAAEKYTIRANEHLLLDEAGDVKLDKIVAEKRRTHSLDAVLKKRLPGACFDLSGGPPTTGKGTSAPTAYSATALENGGGWLNLEAARLCVALGNGNAEYRSFFSSHL